MSASAILTKRAVHGAASRGCYKICTPVTTTGRRNRDDTMPHPLNSCSSNPSTDSARYPAGDGPDTTVIATGCRSGKKYPVNSSRLHCARIGWLGLLVHVRLFRGQLHSQESWIYIGLSTVCPSIRCMICLELHVLFLPFYFLKASHGSFAS